MSFFRQTALLLPSAFLLAVFLFLLTHGRQDPALGAYPFLEQWVGGGLAAATPEIRFFAQACLFFLPAYTVTLLFLLCVALAENALFGARQARRRSTYGRAFAVAFTVLFLLASGAVVYAGDRMAARVVPGALVAPLLVALAPWAGAAVAVLPAALVAAPLAAIRRTDPT